MPTGTPITSPASTTRVACHASAPRPRPRPPPRACTVASALRRRRAVAITKWISVSRARKPTSAAKQGREPAQAVDALDVVGPQRLQQRRREVLAEPGNGRVAVHPGVEADQEGLSPPGKRRGEVRGGPTKASAGDARSLAQGHTVREGGRRDEDPADPERHRRGPLHRHLDLVTDVDVEVTGRSRRQHGVVRVGRRAPLEDLPAGPTATDDGTGSRRSVRRSRRPCPR